MLKWLTSPVEVDQLIARGRLRQATKQLRRQVAAEPGNARLVLKLADILARDDQQDEAVTVLMPLVERFARDGFVAKAVAVLKKIERLDPEHAEPVQQLIARLSEAEGGAPVPRPDPPGRAEPSSDKPARLPKVPPKTSELRLSEDWLADAQDRDSVSLSPLFENLSQRELEAVIGEVQLVIKNPGAIIFSQGEPGASLFVLASGAARVYVRDPTNRNRQVGVIEDGAFFGGASLVQGTPRAATIVAASTCELLELGRDAYDRICRNHPEVRQQLTDHVVDHRDHGRVMA